MKHDDDLLLYKIISICLILLYASLILVSTISDIILKTLRLKCFRQRKSILDLFLDTFSLYRSGTNYNNTRKDEFPFLNGVRIISAYWIILGHTFSLPYIFSFEKKEYFAFLNKLQSSIMWMPIENFTVSVDTFYFIGGFLTFHSTWKTMERNNGKINIFLFIFNKYWRLTSGVIFLIIISPLHLYLSKQVSYYNIMYGMTKSCQEYWWLTLLYIQNYSEYENMCLPQSWFLALLMQYHIVALLLIYITYRKPYIGLIFGTCLTITGNMITFAVLNNNKNRIVVHSNDSFKFRDYYNEHGFVYRMPYYHFGAYFIGMLTAYLILKHSDVKFTKIFHWIGWATSFLFIIIIVFSRRFLTTKQILFMYESWHRTFWSFNLMWITYACAMGQGGVINTFLSWSPFSSLGHLSYFLYLTHPSFILMDAFNRMDYPEEVPSLICRSIIYSFVGLVQAYFCVILIEMPFSKIKMILLNKLKIAEKSKDKEKL